MSEEIKVPEAMLNVAANEFFKAASLNGVGSATDFERLSYALKSALRWLDAELEEMDKEEPFDRDLQIRRVRDLWTAHDPETISDLLVPIQDWWGDGKVKSRILEAYKRGKESK